MDGVVLEGRGTPQSVYDRAAERAAAEMGVEPSERGMSLLREHGYVTVARGCSRVGVDPKEFWRLKEKNASAVSHERLRSGERGVYDDTDAVVELAEETNVTAALVSNNRQQTVEFVADHFSLPFEVTVGRDPTPEGFGRRKPMSYLLVEASEALDAEPWLYVGDRRKDVVAARGAGMGAAFLRRPHNEDTQLPRGATHELESLEDLLRVVG